MPSPRHILEEGIGERRYAIIDDGEIVEARVSLHGIIPAGTVLDAKLLNPGQGGRNAVAEANGQEYLLQKAPQGVTQGATFRIAVTREKIPGAEPWKRPLACAADATFAGNVARDKAAIASVARELDDSGWDDLIDEARSGIVRFPGGELRVAITPAMTLIDVDGQLAPAELAIAGASAAAKTIRRHGIGGSIGIDLPTVEGKAARQAAVATVDDILPQPFERTAVNGFGFLQIIRPRRHASLFELASDRASFEARALLRRAARETGAIRLAAHPAVVAVLEATPGWIDQLSRQVGGIVTLRSDASLAMSAGHAERP